MQKPLYLLFLLLSFLFPHSVHALPKSNAVPGGIALVEITAEQVASSARYKNKKLAHFTQNNKQYLLVGLGLNSKPGKHSITIQDKHGKKQSIKFKVKSKTYKAQYLTIKNKRKVNPYKKDMDRILSEKKRKKTAKKTWSNTTANVDFIVPVEGRISSIFGLRRFFNEQARRPHSGLDIAAPKGTPIKAVADGTVIESGDFFFSGNMVYIDHGQGLISLYAHMNRIDIKTGDQIKQGQVIGTVGETGRVTGPHLHLAVIANQAVVDPILFLPQLSKPTEKQSSKPLKSTN